MATKTYLQLVNDVLGRLREDPVTTVSQTTYSALIGAWVNDAKRLVEDAWNWQTLETAVPVAILPSTTFYIISSLNERSRLMFAPTPNSNIPLAWDITTGDKFQLIYRPYKWIITQRALQNIPQNQEKPIIFGIHKGPASGVIVELMETPTANRTWSLRFIDPQDDLSIDSDVINVPYAPVVQIALDYALNERGEEIGEPGTTVQQKAMTHIYNAVSLDAIEQDGATTWAPN